MPGYPAGHTEDQSWWCGYGPALTEAPRIVVCAVIENGGHGSTAAAPAALSVFEKFFGVEGRRPDPREHGLMIVDAGTPASRRSRRDAVDVAALVAPARRVLLLAAAALVAYGLWAVAGITRFDVPGDPDYFVVAAGDRRGARRRRARRRDPRPADALPAPLACRLRRSRSG